MVGNDISIGGGIIMKKVIMALFLFTVFGASSYAGIVPDMVKSSWDINDLVRGQFCNIESAEVCSNTNRGRL